MIKSRNLISSFALICLLPLTSCEPTFNLSAPDQEITFGQSIDYSLFTLTVNDIEIPVTQEMVTYDPDIIGTQIATFSFKNHSVEFILTINPIPLINPRLSTSGESVIWNSVTNASYYTLIINDNIYTTEDTFFSFSEMGDINTFTVKIKSCSMVDAYVSSDYTNPITIKRINGVTSLDIDEDRFVWNSFDKASEYIVIDNGVEKRRTIENNTTIDFVVNGNNVIGINPVVNEGYYLVRPYYETFYKLFPVSDFYYHKASKTLYWNHNGEDGYFSVFIDGIFYQNTTSEFIELPSLSNEQHTINIIASKDGNNYISSNEVNYYFEGE